MWPADCCHKERFIGKQPRSFFYGLCPVYTRILTMTERSRCDTGLAENTYYPALYGKCLPPLVQIFNEALGQTIYSFLNILVFEILQSLLQILPVSKTKLWMHLMRNQEKQIGEKNHKILSSFSYKNYQDLIFSICSKLKRQPAPFFLFFSFFNKGNKYKNLVVNRLQSTIKNQLEGSIF